MGSVRKAENVPNPLRANGISLSEKSGKCMKPTEPRYNVDREQSQKGTAH